MGKFTKHEARQLVDSIPSIAIGAEIKLHHCKEGKNNDRLYIKRLKNAYVLYCHHCGNGGYVPVHGLPTSYLQKDIDAIALREQVPTVSNSMATVLEHATSGGQTNGGGSIRTCEEVFFGLPPDCSSIVSRWSSHEAQIWLFNAGIKGDSLKDYPIYWSNRRSAVIVPIHSGGELVGFQQRKFPYNPDYPKWVTFTKKGWKKKDGAIDILHTREPSSRISITSISGNETRDVLVLCEDYVSACRIASVGYDALPMFGTQLSDATLQDIIGKYDRFLVALDNDNRMVRASARQLVTRINLFGKECKNARLSKDPKRYGDSELKGILSGN